MEIDIQKVYDHRSGWHYVAQGEGPMRPIIAEGVTRESAEEAFLSVYGNQYAQQESLTAMSLWR